MTWKAIIWSLLSGSAMLIVSFVMTNMAYMWWANWRHPDNSSMAGMGAFVLGLLVAPVCAFFTILLVFARLDRKKNS